MAPFQVRCRRPEGEAALERYLIGLLTELPNKHGDTMAEAVPGTSAQRLQACLTHMPWDEHDLNHQRGQKMMAEATVGQGVLIVDDTGFAKQGKASVGVARPYAGTLGQVGNCQVAVTCGDSDPQASWPVAVRWYLPQGWTDAPERCRRVRVPAEVTFQTTPQIALALLDQARAWGVPHRGVVAEADDGDHPNCLAGLEARRARSVVAGRAACAVRPKRRGMPPTPRADQGLAALPRRQWRTICWRQGSTGGLRKQVVAGRAWRITSEGQAHIGWLLGEPAARGPPAEHQYDWRTLPASAPLTGLVDYAHRRQAIEQCHEAATGDLGWDQSQGRLWPGFHRHAVTVMLALSLLIWLERRRRHLHPNRGRPRDPFSPSAGSLASCAASGASGGSTVAAPASGALVDVH